MYHSKQLATPPNCPDCGTTAGQLYTPDCDVARCTACGQQRLTCGCKSARSVWTGEWLETPRTYNSYVLTLRREQALAADARKRSRAGLEKWIGQVVKVGFDTDDEQVTMEWMWVRVEAVHNGKLIGKLDNV